MPKNKIDDLRDHLFATIEGLLDKDEPLDIDRAEAVAKVAQVIVNSAKAESDFLKATDASPQSKLFQTKQFTLDQ